MSLTLEEIEHIAELARLELTAEELALYRQQLSSILEHVARLQALDTGDIPPASSGGSETITLELRPDEVRPGLSREALMGNAPDAEEGQFRVPPVLDME